MKNEVPRKVSLLFAMSTSAAGGASATDIELAQNTTVKIATDLDVATTAQAFYSAAQADLPAKYAARNVASQAAYQFVQKAKSVLKVHCGSQFCDAWVDAGFLTSLEVPGSPAELESLVQALNAYFTSNSAHENAPLGVTAAQAQALFNSLKNARIAVNAQRTLRGQKKVLRDAAVRKLRLRIRGLICELEQLIDDLDPRWLSFGFNMPGAPEVPEVPQNVEVDNQVPGELYVTCDAAPLADHYRFWKQVQGTLGEPELAGSSEEPAFVIEGLTPGTAYLISVSAVAEGGSESQRSTVVASTPIALAA